MSGSKGASNPLICLPADLADIPRPGLRGVVSWSRSSGKVAGMEENRTGNQSGATDQPADESSGPTTLDPQRLLRIAGVSREVLEEARRFRPESDAVDHLKRVHAQITEELRQALPAELFEELDDLTPDVKDGSLEELSLAHAEILGWLEGLFQGTQLALQMQAARSFQEQARRQLGGPQFSGQGGSRAEPPEEPDGRYL